MYAPETPLLSPSKESTHHLAPCCCTMAVASGMRDPSRQTPCQTARYTSINHSLAACMRAACLCSSCIHTIKAIMQPVLLPALKGSWRCTQASWHVCMSCSSAAAITQPPKRPQGAYPMHHRPHNGTPLMCWQYRDDHLHKSVQQVYMRVKIKQLSNRHAMLPSPATAHPKPKPL